MIIDSECSQGHLPPHLYFVVSKLAEVIVIMENSSCDKPLNQRTLSLMMCHLDQTNSDIKMSRTTNKTIFMEHQKIVPKCQVIQFSRFSQKFKILQSKVECHPELWFYKKRVDHVLDEPLHNLVSPPLSWHCYDLDLRQQKLRWQWSVVTVVTSSRPPNTCQPWVSWAEDNKIFGSSSATIFDTETDGYLVISCYIS